MKLLNVSAILLFLAASPVIADDSYRIERDGAIYVIVTDNDGSWEIERGDFDIPIKDGDTGTYQIVWDRTGTYIVTSNHGEYQIDRYGAETMKVIYPLPSEESCLYGGAETKL